MKNKTTSGQFRQKRSDTLIGTIQKQYKVKFDVRPDMKLGNYLEKEGLPSLNKALQKLRDK